MAKSKINEEQLNNVNGGAGNVDPVHVARENDYKFLLDAITKIVASLPVEVRAEAEESLKALLDFEIETGASRQVIRQHLVDRVAQFKKK